MINSTKGAIKGGLYIVMLAVFSFSALAQTGAIKGVVKTADGKPAAFVNVSIKGTNKGNTTTQDGLYEIKKVQPGAHVLVCSYVGFEPVESVVQVTANETVQLDFVLHETSSQLNEIEITAAQEGYKVDGPSPGLRLQTPLIETPQNIQVVSRQLIDDQQIFDILEGVTRNVSGVQREEHWDNYARISMRGSQVTAFRNGMNVTMPFGPLAEDMSMVERIEFVKGPAGFMLANGEPSGFYNVVTKKPTGVNKGEATITLGSFQTYRSTLDLDGKLSKNGKLLYRFNVMGQLKGSHRDFEYNNRYSIVPVLKYIVDDKTSVTLEYSHQFSQMSIIGSNYSYSRNGYGDLPVNFTIAEPNMEPTEINDRSALLILQHKLNDRWSLTGQISYFNYKQVGQSLWLRYGKPITEDGFIHRSMSIWDALGFNRTGQVFVNGEEMTGSIRHKILAGIDIGHKEYYADWNATVPLGDSTFNIYNPRYGTVPASTYHQFDRSTAIRERGVRYEQQYSSIYVQDELGFLDNRIRLTLAGRFTQAKDVDPYATTTPDDKKFTPRVGLSVSLDENTSVYGVYDQAFLPNPGRDYQGNTFDPITGNNLEAGIKREWMNGKWNAGLTAYQITKNNILVTDTEHPDPVTGALNYLQQIGQSRTRGIEFDARGEIVRNVELIVNYALTEAKITEDTNEENVGAKVPGPSKHITNAWLSYRPQGALQGFGISLGYQWQIDRTSWYVYTGPGEGDIPDYFRLDGAVSWHNDKLSIGLNVNNLLDDYLYTGSPYDFDGDGITEYSWQSEPRMNFRLNLGYKF